MSSYVLRARGDASVWRSGVFPGNGQLHERGDQTQEQLRTPADFRRSEFTLQGMEPLNCLVHEFRRAHDAVMLVTPASGHLEPHIPLENHVLAVVLACMAFERTINRHRQEQ